MKGGPEDIYAFSAPLLNGQVVNLSEFQGRVLVIVNTASRCGLTPQYAGLEQLFHSYKDRGFAVLGFPCNQFGSQEPGTEEEIGAFCEKIYGVSFPMFAKIDVNGPASHPLYRLLKERKRGFLGMGRITWNFTKFLVDRNGCVVRRFSPGTDPKSIAPEIEKLL
jgi:glutathione peroxidase